VHGDPVPISLIETMGWRDLGVLIKDEIQAVNRRAQRFYGKNVSGFFSLHGWQDIITEADSAAPPIFGLVLSLIQIL